MGQFVHQHHGRTAAQGGVDLVVLGGGQVPAARVLDDALTLASLADPPQLEASGVDRVLHIVHRIGDVVCEVHDLRLEARLPRGGNVLSGGGERSAHASQPAEHRLVVLIHAKLARGFALVGLRSLGARPGVLARRVQGGAREVQPGGGAVGPEGLGLQARQQAQRLGIALEAAAVPRQRVKRLLAVVAKGRVTKVVRQARRVHHVRVAAQRGAQLAAHLGHLERVRQAGADKVVGVRGNHLRLGPEPAQRRAVQYAGAVTLEGGAVRLLGGLGNPAVLVPGRVAGRAPSLAHRRRTAGISHRRCPALRGKSWPCGCCPSDASSANPAAGGGA